MRCFFSSDKDGPADQPGTGCVSFAIPELNITFRARYHGTAAACEYASLLALLEFVEINPKIFRGRALEIFGDSSSLVDQLHERTLCRRELEGLRSLALNVKQRLPYSIAWVPSGDNPARPDSCDF